MSETPGFGAEPHIAVGLVDGVRHLDLSLRGEFQDQLGHVFAADKYRVQSTEQQIEIRPVENRAESGPVRLYTELTLSPRNQTAQFTLIATIGVNFHWQQQEEQSFSGQLRLLLNHHQQLVAINNVLLESYLTSVICSEMSAASPPDLLRAHAVISRSWLLAQLQQREQPRRPLATSAGEHIRVYDRQAHDLFDVCADDHCQRYQGTGRITSRQVAAAVTDTRGQVLQHQGSICDARFAKCCGGVTEQFSSAWHDVDVPYLVAFSDAEHTSLPTPPLTEHGAAQNFIQHPPQAYCNCNDDSILKTILPSYDQNTQDFFRWRVELTAEQISGFINSKLDRDLGRLLTLTPVERGPSGRLTKLRLVAENGSLVVGKELEIRRLLAKTHLYSSAFVVETQGPPSRPDLFVLIGAGWGHGVGLCQIGAAVMAAQGHSHNQILLHYYPNTSLVRCYS